MKSKEIGEFDGSGVEHFIKSMELMASIYDERSVCATLPKCMKKAARDWLASMPSRRIRDMTTLDQWIEALRDEFGDSTRRLRGEAED